MTVQIRPLASGDGLALIEFEEACGGDRPSLLARDLESLIGEADPKGACLAAFVHGRVVALGAWRRLRRSEQAEVTMVLGPSEEDSGLGAALLRALAASAAARGIQRFVQCSLPEEANLRRVVHEAGFEAAVVHHDGFLRLSFLTTSGGV
jgi:N-acetylglutamate synthase-like GNAT family acetyltransferase